MRPRCESASVEHERDAPRQRGEPDRAGDVAAAAQHGVGAVALEDAARRRRRAAPARSTARAALSGFEREMPSTRSVSSS